jgi:hypothetical protein
MALSKAQRNALPATDFAVPEKRLILIHDEMSTRLAWNNVSQTAGLNAGERKQARLNIMARAEQFGINTKHWHPIGEAHSARLPKPISISAMSVSIDIPDSDHPNKMPFSGILTRLDQPSSVAPKGSNGRRIQVSTDAAERALPSLLGMAVDYKPDFTGHDPQAKIGIITAANTDGDAIHVSGFIYARDFPEAAADIKEHQDVLGFSFEAADIYVTDPDADILEVQAITFTGAAIMQKALAAYQSTSLAAEADDDEQESEMDKDTKDAIDKMGKDIAGVVSAVGDLAKLVTVQAAGHLDKVKPFADALETEARKLESAGIGLHPTHGHVAVLRRMAAQMCSEASNGVMPSTFSGGGYYAAGDLSAQGDSAKAIADAVAAAQKPLLDQIAALGTKIADIKASAASSATAPERRSLPPEITTLLAKAGIAPKDGEKVEVSVIDKALKDANITGERAIALKSTLHACGVLA